MLPKKGTLSPKVTGQNCRVPSTLFSQTPQYFYTNPPVSVSSTVLILNKNFPETFH